MRTRAAEPLDLAGPERVGRILLVNGTSSSGKTTLVRALQAALPDPWREALDGPARSPFRPADALSG